MMSDRMMRLPFHLILFGLLFGAPLSFAAGPKPLTADQKTACEKRADTLFHKAREVDLGKFSKPSDDIKKFPFQVPLAITTYNRTSAYGEGQLNYHIEQMRQAFRKCGIEVVVHSVNYIEGPEYLENLVALQGEKRQMSDQEVCLFNSLHKPAAVNLFFVPSAESEDGQGGAHALSRRSYMGTSEYSKEKNRRFAGSVIMTDGAASGEFRAGAAAHEVGHILMDQGHTSGSPNLMNELGHINGLALTDKQCEAARKSPFVQLRANPDDANALAATQCCPTCEGRPSTAWDPRVSVCDGDKNIALKGRAFCPGSRTLINPYAVALSTGVGTAACRYSLLKQASQQGLASAAAKQLVVAEGAALYVFNDCRIGSIDPVFEMLAHTVGENLNFFSAKDGLEYCRLTAPPRS